MAIHSLIDPKKRKEALAALDRPPARPKTPTTEPIQKAKLIPEQQKKLNDELREAARKGETRKAMELIEQGADVNARDDNKWTALMYASWHGHTETVSLLINKGAEVNVKNIYGSTARMYACENGHVETAALLRQHGAME